MGTPNPVGIPNPDHFFDAVGIPNPDHFFDAAIGSKERSGFGMTRVRYDSGLA